MKRSTLLFWLTGAAVAIGFGALVAKWVPGGSALHAAPAPSSRTASTGQRKPYLLKFVQNPELVPPFSVQSFTGQTLNPAEWRGKVVILNFWATWCGPCRYEIPELMAMQKQFQGSLQVVGLSVDDLPAPQVKSFIGQFGVNYPVAMADEKVQDEFGGILALPTTFIIDRQGRVVTKHIGLVPRDYYDAEIAYLAGQPVDAKVQRFVDVGQVFPANVKNATSLPGVDLSHLTPAQRKLALKEMNQMRCTCGCGYTIAQCRVLDSGCPISLKIAQQVVANIARGRPVSAPAKATR